METRKRNRRNDSESTNSKSPTTPIISKLKNEPGRPESPAYATRSRKRIDDNLESLSANLNDQRRPRSQKNSESEMGSLASSANNSPTRPLKKASISVDNCDSEETEQKGHRMTAKLNEVKRRTLRGRIIEEPNKLDVAETLLQEAITRQARVLLNRIGDDLSLLGTLNTVPSHQTKSASMGEKEVQKELENLEDWCEDEEHSKQKSEAKKIDSSSDEEPFTKGHKEKHKQIIESDSKESDSEKEDSEDEEKCVDTRKSRTERKSKKQIGSKNTRTDKCETSPVLSRTKVGKASQPSPEQLKVCLEEHATSPVPSENAGLSSKYRGTPTKNKTKSTRMSLPPAVVERLVSSSTKFLDYNEELLSEESENGQVSQVALENELEKCLESDVSIDSVSTVESPSKPTNNAAMAEKKSPIKSNSMVQSPGKVELSPETCSEVEEQSQTSAKALSLKQSSSFARDSVNSFETSGDLGEVEKNKSVSPRKIKQEKSPVKEGNKSKSPGKLDKTVQLEAAEESVATVELHTKSSNTDSKVIEESDENDADDEMSTITPIGKTTQVEESDHNELPSKSPSKRDKAAEESEESDSENKLKPQSPIKSNKLGSGGFKLSSNTVEQGYESSDDIKSDDSSPFKSPCKTEKSATSIQPESPGESVPDDELPNVSPSKSDNAALNTSNKEEENNCKNQSPSKTASSRNISENELPIVFLSKLDKVAETRESDDKHPSKYPGKTNINKIDSCDESEVNKPLKKSPVKAKKQEVDSSDESESDEGDKQPTSSPVKPTQRKTDGSDESEDDEPPKKSPVKAKKQEVDSSDESESDEGDKQPTSSPVKPTQRKTDSSDESENDEPPKRSPAKAIESKIDHFGASGDDESPKKSPGNANKSKIDNSEESDENDKVPISSPAKANKRKLDSSDDDESDEQKSGGDAELQKSCMKNGARRNRKSILNVSTENETASPQTRPRAAINKNSSNVDSSKTLPRKSDPKHFTHLQSHESSEESELSGSETPQKSKLVTQKSKVSVEAKPAVQLKQPKTSAVTTPRVNKPLTIIEKLNQCLKNLPPSSTNAPGPDKEQKQPSAQLKKQQPVSVTSSESEDSDDSEIEYRMVKIIPKESSSTSAKQTSLPTKKKVALSTSEDSSDDEIETVKTITKPTTKVSASTKTSTLPVKMSGEVRVSSESDDSSDDDIEIVKTFTKPTAKFSETAKTSALPEKRKGEELVSPVSKKPKQWSWCELNDNEEQDLWGNSVIKSTVKLKRNMKDSSVRQQRKLDLEKQLRALRNWNVTEVQETAEVRMRKDWQVTETQEEANVSVSSAWKVTEVGDAGQNKKRKRSSTVPSDAKYSGGQSSAIPSKQDSQMLTNGGKKPKISELNKAVTNEQEGSDSDDAPDEQSFTASRMSAFAVIKHAMQSAQLGQQATKKKRREKHERFMAQKQNSEKTDEKATAWDQGQTKSKADGQQQDKKILGSKLPMSVLEQLDPHTTTTNSKKKKQKQQSQPLPTEVQTDHTTQMQPSQQTEGEQPKSKSQIRREKKMRQRLLAAAQANTDVPSAPQTSHVTKFVIADPSAVEAATKSKADKWRQRVLKFKPKLSATKANAIKERLKWSNQGQNISTWST